jgi:hypothetical protein
MKNVLVILAFSLLIHFSESAYSQNVGLNITLSPTLVSVRISDLPPIQVSKIGYAKYDEGINALVKDHINIVSSGAYIVKVSIGDIISDSKLGRNSIKITPQLGSDNQGNFDDLIINSAIPPNFQKNTQIKIIESDHASWNSKNSVNTFNVTYLIGADGAFAGRVPGISIIPVIYTIILK